MLNLPKLIGHRGVKNLSPENTIESIDLAKKLGLNWVEIDVKISKDLIPILLHDDNLERTAKKKWLPPDHFYKDIKKLDAGYHYYKKATKIYIPTLQEVLLFCNKKKINLNIELKPNKGFEKENIKSIIKVLSNMSFTNYYYFSSFDWKSLIMMKEIFPNANYGLLLDKFKNNTNLSDIKMISKKYDFFCCGFNNKIINSEIVREMIDSSIVVSTYSEKNMSISSSMELWDIGVKSIFIDDPSKFNLI
ncbi:glycerophosphodiester phosphodiesterase family protein [Alphaproteobacteria bacterium]|nr:glycerophosphodiester phosphodiesterase family protein [Alphaproteobacteria bacterium]